jgi:hypothetical protein
VRFFSDAHETATFIFSKLNVEMLPLNLKLSRRNDVVHDLLGGIPLSCPGFYPTQILASVSDTVPFCRKYLFLALSRCNPVAGGHFPKDFEVDLLADPVDFDHTNFQSVADTETGPGAPTNEPFLGGVEPKEIVV